MLGFIVMSKAMDVEWRISVDNKKVVQGFEFENEQEYEMALKDAEMFDILWDKIKNSDGQFAIELYESLLSSDKIKTVVGMYNVKMLQNYLIRHGYVAEREIKPIVGFVGKKVSTVDALKSYEYTYKMKYLMGQKINDKLEKYKSTVAALKIAVLILTIVIVVMFVVQTNGGNANYASAKEAVTDEYASWEQELSDREEEVKKREEEIKAKELE